MRRIVRVMPLNLKLRNLLRWFRAPTHLAPWHHLSPIQGVETGVTRLSGTNANRDKVRFVSPMGLWLPAGPFCLLRLPSSPKSCFMQ